MPIPGTKRRKLLYTLAEEGLLRLDHDAVCWSWDLDRIHAKGYTDNVVDLLVGKVTGLPVKTQQALQQLACLGNVATIAMLSTVLEAPEEQVHGDLWPSSDTCAVVRSTSTAATFSSRCPQTWAQLPRTSM